MSSNEAITPQLHGMSARLYKKVEVKLRSVVDFEKIMGGRFYTGISYVILFGIPLWFQKSDSFLFITERGVFIVHKTLWWGFEVPAFFDHPMVRSITTEKKFLARKMIIEYSNGDLEEFDCGSGSFLDYLIKHAKDIQELAPKLSIKSSKD